MEQENISHMVPSFIPPNLYTDFWKDVEMGPARDSFFLDLSAQSYQQITSDPLEQIRSL